MANDIDPEQSVSIVAVFLFLYAAFIGFPMLPGLVAGAAPDLFGILLVAGLIAAGVGLLQGRQWAWWLAMVVIGISALINLARFSLFPLLIDALVIFLLTRPSTRARFGVR
jgi:cell division protein FtsW (lipid II flippase)